MVLIQCIPCFLTYTKYTFPVASPSSQRRAWPAGRWVGGQAGSVLVPLHVQRQVVGAREAAVAHSALKGLGARVLAVMACELVGACEAPVAAFPRALVGLLTSMSPQVSF